MRAVVISGVALLSGCLRPAAFLGDMLGGRPGVEAHAGVVGIAMFLLA